MANNNDQLMQYNLFIQNFTNSIPLKQLIMYQKISNNYQSIPLGREKESFILKRIKKPKRFALNVKDAEQNPIYRVMKNQREITPILNAILNNPELGLKNSQKEQHSHSRLLDVHQLSTVEIYNKSESNKQMETFKQKAVRIMAGTRMMTEQLEKSKRKINILDKFNKKVEKYCSYLPQTPDQQRNQSQNANDQLIKLCRHNFFPTQDLHKRAHSLLHYREPHISTSKIKRLKERTKTSSLNRPSQASPMKRFLTLNI